MLRTYYRLTKPGIIYGNALATVAGFLLAARGDVKLGLLLSALAGISLVIASACVVNNYIDRDIDRRMQRTKRRALVTGEVTVRRALVFAAVIGLAGFCFLGLLTNLLAFAAAVVGYVFYVVLYGIAKRQSVHGTLVGSVSGAMPPVVGYLAAAGQFELGAGLIFLVLVCWQMPHFYAIAMYRAKDYAAASLPVWPVVRGFASTRRQMIGYIIGFVTVSLSLPAFGLVGIAYAIVMAGIGLWWLWRAVRGFGVQKDEQWARQLFSASLIVLLTFCVMAAVDVRGAPPVYSFAATLTVHMTLSLLSLVAATYAYRRPSQKRLRLTILLASCALVSSAYLTALRPAHLVTACLMGIFYAAMIVAGLLATRRKLQRAGL